MTSKHFFALGGIGSSLALASLVATGCGGNANTSMGGSTSHTTTTHAVAVTVTVGNGGAGGGGTDNHSIDNATEVSIDGTPASATLVDPFTSDFYSFTGTAGERIAIAAAATGLVNSGFDGTVTDLTLGLFGPDKDLMNPLTYQSDAWPAFSQDAVLYVELPADGTYFVAVQDCNGFFSSGCPNSPDQVIDLNYDLIILQTSNLNPAEVLGAAATGTPPTGATPVVYKPASQPGQFFPVSIGGEFSGPSDTQVFSFTPPTASKPSAGVNARAEFYVQPIGGVQGGDLSDANIKLWVTDSTGNVVLSQADQTKFVIDANTFSPLEFSVPFTAGQQYFLFVQNEGASGGKVKDTYFIQHYLNPLIDVAEKEGPTKAGTLNDTFDKAETLTLQGQNKSFYTIDGNITTPGATGDIDWYTFPVPAGFTQYLLQCDSARSGSGLVGFHVQLFGSDHTTSLLDLTETPDADLGTMPGALPNGVSAGSTLFLELGAASQDATVTGTQYRCYVFFGK